MILYALFHCVWVIAVVFRHFVFCNEWKIIQFRFVLESHVVECSIESFLHRDYKS